MGRRRVAPGATGAANRAWWDEAADGYLAEHGRALDGALVWGPEGWRETELRLLGPLAGKDVLDVGCGAGQSTRWVAQQGARVLGGDLSAGMLAHARNARYAPAPGPGPAFVQCDATALPFAERSFDVAFSAYGALPFVDRPHVVMSEVARVLRPGGRWVFAVPHPVRWSLPDDPGSVGLVVRYSYFDETPYVETDEGGRPRYVEHHRTLGGRVRDIVSAGLVLDDIVEPPWPDRQNITWGGWSPQRGRLVPGTAIFVCHRPVEPARPPRPQ